MFSKIQMLFGVVSNFIIKRWFVSMFIVLVVGAGGYYGFVNYWSNSENGATYVTEKIKLTDIKSIVSGSGRVLSSREVELTPDVSGKVVWINKSNGDFVKRGQAILSIDGSDSRQDVEDAKISLETVKLELEEMLKPADEIDILQAENDLILAQKAQEDIESEVDDFYKNSSERYNFLNEFYVEMEDIMEDFAEHFDENMYDGNDFETNLARNNLEYYKILIEEYNSSAGLIEDDIKKSCEKSLNSYIETEEIYKNVYSFSESSDVIKAINKTQDFIEEMNVALNKYVNFIKLYKNELEKNEAAPKIRSNVNPLDMANSHLIILNSYETLLGDYEEIFSEYDNQLDTLNKNLTEAKLETMNEEKTLQDLRDGPDELTIRAKNITIKQKENNLREAREILGEHVVYAPFDGILTDFDITLGEQVSTSTNVAYLITTQNKAEIEFNEIDFIKIEKGQKAIITFDAFEDLEVIGEVSSLDVVGKVTSGVVTYNVEILFDAKNENIKNGMSLLVDIVIEFSENTVVIPSSAISTMRDKLFVRVLENGKPRQVPITIGVENDTHGEILSGLSKGMELITKTIEGANGETELNPKNNSSGLGIPGFGTTAGSGRFRPTGTVSNGTPH